jgi:hypothetical protein
MRAYSGDYTLGGQVVLVDLLGQASDAQLEARAGYLRPDDGLVYRALTITIPLVRDDLWTQEA